MAEIKESCPERFDEISTSITDFPARLKKLAVTIPLLNNGPFPLCHPDFGHQNIIVDENYNILGVIDWEDALCVPWEVVNFSLEFSIVPVIMRLLWYYDEDGELKYKGLKLKPAKRAEYVNSVREME